MSLDEKMWRVIPAELRHPAEIIAMEEVLHDFVGKGISPKTLALHHWQPSVSIAKPQSVSDLNLDKCAEYGIKVVRTAAGGRAVFHDTHHDISYSALFPSQGSVDPVKFYDMFCGKLANAVEKLGLPVEMKNEYDFYVGSKKIGGNAQRLSNGAVMQHGILLFDYNEYPLAERMVSLMDSLYSPDDIDIIQSSLTWIREHKPAITLGEVYAALIDSMTDSKFAIGNLTLQEKQAIQVKRREIEHYDWHTGIYSRGWCWAPRGAPKGTLYREAVA